MRCLDRFHRQITGFALLNLVEPGQLFFKEENFDLLLLIGQFQTGSDDLNFRYRNSQYIADA